LCVGWVCYHDNSKLRASILTKMGFIGKGSDHLQLIKVWPSCATGKGVCGGGANFFWLRLTTASAQCLRLLWALFHFFSGLLHISLSFWTRYLVFCRFRRRGFVSNIGCDQRHSTTKEDIWEKSVHFFDTSKMKFVYSVRRLRSIHLVSASRLKRITAILPLYLGYLVIAKVSSIAGAVYFFAGQISFPAKTVSSKWKAKKLALLMRLSQWRTAVRTLL